MSLDNVMLAAELNTVKVIDTAGEASSKIIGAVGSSAEKYVQVFIGMLVVLFCLAVHRLVERYWHKSGKDKAMESGESPEGNARRFPALTSGVHSLENAPTEQGVQATARSTE